MLKIAKKFGVTMEALLAANPKIKNPNKIGSGTRSTSRCPRRTPATAACRAARGAVALNGAVDRAGSPGRTRCAGREVRGRVAAPARQRENGVRLIEVILPASTRNWASRCWLGAPGRRTTRSAW